MKKEILIALLSLNLIAGSFVFCAFTSKAKAMNDEGKVVLIRVIEGGLNEIIISDGNTILENDDLLSETKKSILNSNSQVIAQKLNEYKNKGYELISSNASGNCTNYIFEKK